MSSIQILHGRTKDDLSLQGFHWSSSSKNTCIVFIHGMSGNFIENYFTEVLGKKLSKNDFGFIFGHNRGYGHINDIKTSEIQEDGGNKTKRIGAIYEKFEESINDIDLWLNEAKKLGYEKIILMGHSLGCNKVIHYQSVNKDNSVTKIILASPPDMVGLAKLEKYQPNYSTLLQEAKDNINKDKTKKILSSMLWDWYYISSETFLNQFQDNCVADNLPLLRNPEIFDELSKIDIPIFAFMEENDDTPINTIEEDLNQIKEKATACTEFETAILAGANHNYENKEKELSQLIIDWLNKK